MKNQAEWDATKVRVEETYNDPSYVQKGMHYDSDVAELVKEVEDYRAIVARSGFRIANDLLGQPTLWCRECGRDSGFHYVHCSRMRCSHVDIVKMPAWLDLRDAIGRALLPWPEASSAVMVELTRLGNVG